MFGNGKHHQSSGATGSTVISLDSDPQYNATIVGSILDWDYGAYAPRYFSLITASPPCTNFSQVKTTGQRDLEYAPSLVQGTLEIISYFQLVTFDCSTEALQRRVLELVGIQMVDHLGLPLETISVEAVKNTPLSYPEIVRIVDTQVEVDRETKRLASSDSKSTHQGPKAAKEPRKSYVKVVESEPRPTEPHPGV